VEFERLLELQRERSRKASKFGGDIFKGEKKEENK